tara:strand:+ start:6246 stop:6809 length:564 start_codon:yes stop_codon:yes gene_type:complete
MLRTPSSRPDRLVGDLLVLEAMRGDRAAFEQLVAHWQERLWQHAYGLTRRDAEAWDVVQESWIAIARGLRRLKEPQAFRAWAFMIVTRAAIARARRVRIDDGARDITLEPEPALANDTDDRSQAVADLRAALSRLDDEERALLSLRYLEELELTELARVFDIPVGTVKSRLHTARARLKNVLERMQR